MIYDFKAYDPKSKLSFDIQLEKDKRLYCFIGENGAGKTRLLESMANTLVFMHWRFRKADSKFAPYFMDHVDLDKFETVVDVRLNQSVVVIKCEYPQNGAKIDFKTTCGMWPFVFSLKSQQT